MPSGLDGMMGHIQAAHAPAPAPVVAPVPAVEMAPAAEAPAVPVTIFRTPVGKLDISAATDVQPQESPKLFNEEASAMRLIGKTTAKKPVVKKMGAKKLVDNPAADRLVSFEVIEQRQVKAVQEEEDRKLAVKLQDMEVTESGGSRIAAALREEEVSKYRSQPAPAVHSSRPGVPAASHGSAGESFAAREKYSKAKSISSDQYFGHDQADADRMRGRIEKFSNSSAISSSMLYDDEAPRNGSGNLSGRYVSNGNGEEGLSLDKLKDSVSGFFEDMQRRF